MNHNKQTKINLFFFFLIISINFVVIQESKAQTLFDNLEASWDSVDISASALQFDLELPISDGRIRKGTLVTGIDESRRIQQSEVSTLEDPSIKLFKAKFFYKARANLYTAYIVDDPYGALGLIQNKKAVNYLKIYTSRCALTPNFNPPQCYWEGAFIYSFQYTDFDLPILVPNIVGGSKQPTTVIQPDRIIYPVEPIEPVPTPDPQVQTPDTFPSGIPYITEAAQSNPYASNLGYHSRFVNVLTNFIVPIGETIEYEGQEFTLDTQNLQGDIKRVILVNAEETVIGRDNVQFVGDEQAEAINELISENRAEDISSEASVRLQLNEYGILGVTPSDELLPVTALGQSGIAEATEGNLPEIEENKFRFQSSLRPSVTVFKQLITFRHQNRLVIDTEDTLLSPSGIIAQLGTPSAVSTIDRIVGWKIQNFLIQLDFLIEVDVTAEVKVNYNTIGNINFNFIPDFVLSDVYFETILTGTTSITQDLGQGGLFGALGIDPTGLFANLVTIGIIAIVGYLAFTFIIPQLPSIIANFRRRSRRQSRR